MTVFIYEAPITEIISIVVIIYMLKTTIMRGKIIYKKKVMSLKILFLYIKIFIIKLYN